jgi:arsenate reductase-like glutaredoxin family protein
MDITVYHYAGCSTCRKARKFLSDHRLQSPSPSSTQHLACR